MIYDNNSTYEPMLQLLNELENSYTIIRNSENRGPEFVYQDHNLLKTLPLQFLLSDPDLDLNPELPIDFVVQVLGSMKEPRSDATPFQPRSRT